MSTAHTNGNGVKINKTVFTTVVAPICVGLTLAVAGWAYSLQAGHNSQDTRLILHDHRINGHDRVIDRMEGKLDKILERLPP